MLQTPVFLALLPTPTDDAPGPNQPQYDAAQARGEVLHVHSDPERTTVVTTTHAASRSAYYNHLYEVGATQGRLEARLHAGTLLTPESDADWQEVMVLASKGLLIDAAELCVLLGDRLD